MLDFIKYLNTELSINLLWIRTDLDMDLDKYGYTYSFMVKIIDKVSIDKSEGIHPDFIAMDIILNEKAIHGSDYFDLYFKGSKIGY